jgi:hypothetical protein
MTDQIIGISQLVLGILIAYYCYKAGRTKGDKKDNMAKKTKMYFIHELGANFAWMTVPSNLRPFMAKHYGSFRLSPIPDKIMEALYLRGVSLNGNTTAATINPMLRESVVEKIQGSANLYRRVSLARNYDYGVFRLYVYHLTGKVAVTKTRAYNAPPPPQSSKLPETFDGMALYLRELEGKLVDTERLLLAKAGELNLQISYNNTLRAENTRLQSELARKTMGE